MPLLNTRKIKLLLPRHPPPLRQRRVDDDLASCPCPALDRRLSPSDFFFDASILQVQAVVSELTHKLTPPHHTHARTHAVRKLDLQPIPKKLHVAERYPKSTPGFERDRHVTLTIVAHPRVRQSLQNLQKKMGENPCGNRESSRTRTHDRQLHHPEHLPNELRLVPSVGPSCSRCVR